jgi:hypothetical protein
MPLCQFYITPSNNGSDFSIPVSGDANIKVINVQYYNTNSSSAHHVVQVRSDVLRFPYSSLGYLTIFTGAVSTVNFDTGKNEYSINKANLNGRMNLNIVDYNTGAQPTHFGGCLLTLEIEKLNGGF